MLFYFSLFLFFVTLYNWAIRNNSKCLLLIAAIPPILLEGLRDENVGRDMMVYGAPWFYDMNTGYSLWDVIENSSTPEYGYMYVIYFCKKICPDIHLYMTVCATIKLLMVYFAAFKMRKAIHSTVFIFAYYCFFYVTTFSLMRQGIAVAICIYSLTYFLEHKMKMFVVFIIIAYFFHNSAVLMLLFFPIYYIRNMRFKYSIIILGIIFFYTSIEFLFPLLINTSLFKSSMVELYIDSGVPSAKTNILITIIFVIYGGFLNIMKWKKYNERVFLLLTSSMISLMFLFLASYIEVAFRMSYYTFFMSMLLTFFFVKQNRRLREISLITYMFLFLLHFYIECSHGLSDALKYSSKILNI